MQPYDAIAEWYDRTRSDRGVDFCRELLRLDGGPGPVLDLGCGTGRPLGRRLIDAGCAWTGIDASRAMCDLAAANCPEGTVLHADLVDPLPDARFRYVVAWDSIFHVAADRHGELIGRVADALESGGWCLATFGGVAGTRSGTMWGREFTYHSLAGEEYFHLFAAAGMQVVRFERDQHPDDHLVVIAREKGCRR